MCAECAALLNAHTPESLEHSKSWIYARRSMSMNSERRRALLVDSFETALVRDPDFPRLFYEILFKRYPSTERLFVQNTLNVQRTMLSKTLMAAVDHIDDWNWLVSNLAYLGAKHVKYGVTPEMYAWMGEALTASLAEVCAEDWTLEHEIAWRDAYSIIVEAVRSGEQG